MHRGFLSIGAGVAAVSFMAGLHAQQPPAGQIPVFRSGTTLVQLDVVVTDAAGKPVAGLTRDDFTILAGGRERPVVAMNEYHHEAPPAGSLHQDVATNSTQRLVAIVVDDHKQYGAELDLRKDAARQLIRALAGRATLALVRTSREPGVEFTPNAQALLDALNMLPTLPMVTLNGKPVEMVPNTLYNRFEDGVLSASDGRRKTFILITEGALYSRLIDPAFLKMYLEDGGRTLDGYRLNGHLQDEIKRFRQGKLDDLQVVNDLHERLQHVWRVAAQTNASVSIVDPRVPLVDVKVPEDELVAGLAALVPGTLDALVRVTGGTPLVREETVPAAIESIVSDLDHYYVLGFEPVDPANPKARPLEVRTRRPGLSVRTRTSYQVDETARRRILATTKKDPLLGLTYSPLPTADLPLRLWATVLPPADSKAQASIMVWLDNGGAVLKEYATFIVDMVNRKEIGFPMGRKITGVPPDLMPLDVPRVPPGRYQLRVAARDETTGGSVYQTIVVPDFAKTPLAVASLVIGTESIRRADAAPLPFTPTLERVFNPRARMRVGFRVWQPKAAADVRTAIEILDTTGRTVDGINLALKPTDSRIVSTDVYLPTAPGAYTIRVSAFAGTLAASDEISIRVR